MPGEAQRAPRPTEHRRGWWTPLCILALGAFFALWYEPAVFGGRIWVDEDIEAYFFSNRSRLFELTRSAFAWWDPLPGLGQPRLGNIQNGDLAPLSLLFRVFPATPVFRFYPALCLWWLSGFTFVLLRARGLSRGPATFGALSFALMGNVATHLQHPAAIETLIWLPATLWAWERLRTGGHGAWGAAAGLFFAFQCVGGSPQYVVYGSLLMVLWMGAGILEQRATPRELVRLGLAAGAIAVLGAGLASWQLLPAAELADHSHRALLSDPTSFADRFRSSPAEVLRSLAAETYWFREAPVLAHGAPYRSQPNLSLLAVGLALVAMLGRGRPWFAAAGAAFFLLGMLGSVSGVPQLIGSVLPFADALRAPVRMVVPAGFLISFLAAVGLERVLPRSGRTRHALAAVAIAWIASLAWTTRRDADRYVLPSAFDVPLAFREATPRVALDFGRSRGQSVYAFNAGLGAGVGTLFQREVLIPANFFEAYFASQFGSLEPGERIDRVISASAFPLPAPGAPLLRAFGLRTLVRYRDGVPKAIVSGRPLPDHWVASGFHVAPERRERWRFLADRAWDPTTTALLARDPGISPAEAAKPSEVSVVSASPDEQHLEVSSDGGILVSSALFFPGWHVEVDGEAAMPLEANGALRAVALAPGRREVVWRYRPTWLGRAWLGTGMAMAASVYFVLAWRPRSHAE